MKNFVFTRCFICGRNEKLYRKIMYSNGKAILLPNKFYICDHCYKIETNKKYTLPDGMTYEWRRVYSFKDVFKYG
jgi:hypothetical protein